MENIIQYGTLNPDGTVTNKHSMKQSNISNCPFFILVSEHYREDGTCACNNAEHRR